LAVLLRKAALTPLAISLIAIGIWMTAGTTVAFSLWPLLWRTPLLRNIVADRFIVFFWFGAAILLALALDALIEAGRKWHPRARFGVVGGAPVVLLSQLVWASAASLPVNALSVQPDPAITYLSHVQSHRVFLTFPAPRSARAIVQMSTTDFPVSTRWWLRPLDSPRPRPTLDAYSTLRRFSKAWLRVPRNLDTRELARLSNTINAWGTTDIVIPGTSCVGAHCISGYPLPFAALITEMYGMPISIAGEWVWSTSSSRGRHEALPKNAWRLCLAIGADEHGDRTLDCVVRTQGLLNLAATQP
jgi:hypothetical protein